MALSFAASRLSKKNLNKSTAAAVVVAGASQVPIELITSLSPEYQVGYQVVCGIVALILFGIQKKS